MSQWMVLAGLGVFCLILPNALLIPLSVAAVMLADTELLPPRYLYFARFVPIGILAFKSLITVRRGRRLATRPLLLRAWAPFFFLAGVSIVYSVDPWISAQRYVSALFVLVGFGLGIPLFFSSLDDMRRLIRSIGLLMGLAIVYSVFELPSEEAHIVIEAGSRGSGVFKNPNTLGLLAMQAVFLIVYLWQRQTRPFLKYLMLAATLVVGTSVLLSGSRASVLGLAVGLLVFMGANLTLGERLFSNVLRVTVSVLAVLLVVEIFFPEYLGGVLRTETGSREILWGRAWMLAQDQLWLGVGFGASDGLFARDALYLTSIGIHLSGPHSSLMRLLVDLGILGIGLAALALSRLLQQIWRYLRRFDDPRLGAALIGAVAASLVNSAFESWLFAFGSASTLPFWFILALLSHQADVARYRLSRLEGRRRREMAAAQHRFVSRSEAGLQ